MQRFWSNGVTRRKRRVFMVVGVLLVGFALLNLLAYQHAWSMMHFTADRHKTGEPESLSFGQKIMVLLCGVKITRPETKDRPTTLSPECKVLTIPGTNGIRLGAWYCPGPPQSPLVILFHGYIGEKSGTLPEAKALLELGCSVLLVDFRGSGDSSENYTTIGYKEAEDVAAAFTYSQEHLPHSKIILYGQSMGACAVLRAVHSCGVRPDAILIEAVFDRMLTTVQHRFEAMKIPSFPCAQLLIFWGGRQIGFNGFSHNPMDYAAAVNCPALFLHGTLDPRAHIEEARRVFEAVPSFKRFAEFPDCGHEAAAKRFPEKWKDAVGPFLKETEDDSIKASRPPS